MPILAIDTSTGPASAALLGDDGRVIASHEDSVSMRQSQMLVAMVDAMVRGHGGYGDITAFAVTTGPGGFTGIRVALAAARGFALACNAPLIGVTSLESFGWQALHDQPQGAMAVALVNAFRDQAYIQAFRREGAVMAPLCEAQAVDNAAIPAFLAAYPDALLLGNPPSAVTGHGRYTQHPAPHARFTADFARLLLAADAGGTIAARPAEALYIRPPDAKPQKPLLGA